MIRILLTALVLALGAGAALVAQTTQPPAKKADPVAGVLTVLLPEDDAELKIDGKPTKTTGKKRQYDIPALDPDTKYSYTIEIKYAPNNYTTITRTRKITFKGGESLTVDLTKEVADDKAVIRYVPTPADIVQRMLKLGNVGKDDIVYDLGCGDARMVIAAVKDGGAKKGVGIDIDPERIKESTANVKQEKVEGKVIIKQGDLLDDAVLAQVAEATVILIYMGDEFNNILRPKLLKHLKPGTRIVSHRFKMGEWAPDQSISVTGEDGDTYELHLWTVKAK